MILNVLVYSINLLVMESKSYAAVVMSNKGIKETTKRFDFKSSQFVTSYGVACVRKNNDTGNYEVLMIKKRATYAFIDFLRGRYDPMRHYDLEFMFNEMTINEKVLIRSKDFSTIWMYCLGKEPTRSGDKNIYIKSSKKFAQLCEYKNGEFLMDLLNNSTNSELLWEIPKGRIGKNETALESAVREFEEETSIKKDAYKLLFDEGTIEYTFTDAGIKYKYIYYLAIMNNAQQPKFDFDNEHMLIEVSELKFLPANAVYEFNNNRLYKTIRIIIKKLKKYF